MKDRAVLRALKEEITVLKNLKSKHIMKFYDAIDSGNKISIVLEYIAGLNLYQFLRKLPGEHITDETQVKKIFFQICTAVRYMHL